MLLSFIPGSIKALKDCWLVRDDFLRDVFPVFQSIKSSTAITKEQWPYLYKYYNIFCFYQTSLSTDQIGISRILNSFIEGLNQKQKLPKYVLMIADSDIITHTEKSTDIFDFGATIIFEDIMKELFKQLNKAIDRRRTNIIYKCPGALGSTFEPRLIWIKPIKRPYDPQDSKQAARAVLRTKFGSCLDNLISDECYMYIMTLEEFESDSRNLFDANFNMTNTGKIVFWNEINSQMRKFERSEIELKPEDKPKKSRNKNKPFRNSTRNRCKSSTSRNNSPRNSRRKDLTGPRQWSNSYDSHQRF